jgi:protein-tyrosine kinase
MSIVEKAVEILTAERPEPGDLGEMPMDFASARTSATIEQLQDRMRVVQPQPGEASVWHVNIAELKRAGLLPSQAEAAGRLADELRRIKRPLILNAKGEGSQPLKYRTRIMVASAVPGEGKTFTSFNLALSLAQEPDFEVLLVDGDVPKSDITRMLNLGDRPGLMDVLADVKLQPADVIVRTDIPNLSVVPVGRRGQLVSELFGSRRMEWVLEELGGHDSRRLLVFDSAPLLATAEARALAAHVGQIVVVVAAGRTQQAELGSALQDLDGTQYIGLVLNMSQLPASESHYYSYYHNYSKGN